MVAKAQKKAAQELQMLQMEEEEEEEEEEEDGAGGEKKKKKKSAGGGTGAPKNQTAPSAGFKLHVLGVPCCILQESRRKKAKLLNPKKIDLFWRRKNCPKPLYAHVFYPLSSL